MIERLRPDLALLDLEMPELDGLSVVRLLGGRRPPLVAFVTLVNGIGEELYFRGALFAAARQDPPLGVPIPL